MAQGDSSTLSSSNLGVNLRSEVLSFLIAGITVLWEEEREKKRLWKAEWYAKNKGKVKAYNSADHARRQQDLEFQKKKAEASAQWREENPEKVAAQAPMKLAYKKTEKGIAAEKRYRSTEKSKERYRRYAVSWENRCPSNKISNRLRHRIYIAVKAQGTGKFKSTFDLLGCDWITLKSRFESLFQSGMSWENYGEWEIDHTTPCALFNLEDPEQQKCAFHFTNLAPMWASDNVKKGVRLE